MMMKMLEAAGLAAVTDGIRSADDDNPKGYYELEAVKRTKDDPSWVPQARGKVVKVISQLLQDLPSTERFKVIFMRRDLDEVLASQKKMLVNREEEDDADTSSMKSTFAVHVEEVEAWMRSSEYVDVLFVSYNRMQSDSAKQIERIVKFLAGDVAKELNIESMAAVVDPALYRQRKS